MPAMDDGKGLPVHFFSLPNRLSPASFSCEKARVLIDS